jgi:hypothetical protein
LDLIAAQGREPSVAFLFAKQIIRGVTAIDRPSGHSPSPPWTPRPGSGMKGRLSGAAGPRGSR